MRSSNKFNFQNGTGVISKSRNGILSIFRSGLYWISDLLTFRIEYKQLLSMWMICALLLPVFAAPVNIAATVVTNNSENAADDYSHFEPVNGEQSVLSRTKTELSLGIERIFTSSLEKNTFEVSMSGAGNTLSSDDKTKKDSAKKEAESGGENAEKGTSSLEDESKPEAKIVEPEEPSIADAGKSLTEDNKEKEQTEEISESTTSASNFPFVLNQPADRPILNEVDVPKLVSPTNNLGSPMGQTEPSSLVGASAINTRERAGIGNFNFGLPIASVLGRGMNASVGLSYNSQVWAKIGTEYIFNVDGNWMAPGFQIGYGYLDAYREANQVPYSFVLTEPDGTRRQMTPVSSTGTGNVGYTFESNDGSFTKVGFYHCYNCSDSSALKKLSLQYSDGTIVEFSSSNPQNRYFPTKIIDVQGNFINIEYLQNDEVGKISKIIDTLGREILFHYSSTDQKLLAVSVPGFGAASQTQVIRFYYEDLTLQTTNKFNGTITAPPSVSVLKYVYMPGTNAGYRYDYSSYYGMIYKITKLEGMQVTTMSTLQMGSVIIGTNTTEAAWTRYNYLGSDADAPGPIPSLSDVPKYTKRTDDWIGRTGTNVPEIIYDPAEDTTTRTTQITGADNVISVTVSNKKPGLWDDGLIKETYITSPGRTIPWSKTIYTWQEGQVTHGRKNPRVQKLETINEAGQAKAQTFEYDQFNNQTVIKEHDYAATGQLGAELRRTEVDYLTGGSNNGWVGRNLIHLPTSVKKIVNNTISSRTDYEYDGFQLLGYGVGTVIHHDARFNPDTPDGQYCQMECPSECVDPAFPQNCTCDRVEVCYPIPIFEASTNFRGNITKITRFADATNNNDPNKSIDTIKYDITGNLIEASMNCCSVKTIEYSPTYHYAYPTKETKGSSVQIISNIEYDLHTGLVTKTIDANNQETIYEYESDTFRQKKTIYPNGGYVLTEYSDKLASGSVPGFVRTTTTLETNKTVQSYSYFDGRGLGIRSATETTDGWSVSIFKYDSLGRPTKSYNSFYAATPNDITIPAGTAFTEVVNYDGLSRTTSVKLQDNTIFSIEFNTQATTPASFNKTFAIATDQAGKQRRQLVDALGRIVRVDEPNVVNGSLGAVDAAIPQQQTAYEYDGNDNLTKVTQSDGTTTQERVFKYDSLSRLTHERQVEALPKLDNDGVHGAFSPTKWTKVLKYNTDGLVIDSHDARGINTHVAYDGLNRISQITYSDGTPTVTYTYDQARTGFFNKGTLTRVETAIGDTTLRPNTPATAIEFDYDKMGRAVKHRQSIGAQVYNLEYNYNLAGQLISEKYPSGKILSTSYDSKGRLAQIADTNRTYLSGLEFHGKANSLSSMTYGNGTKQIITLNDRLQMTNQELKKGAEVLQKYDYGYGQIDTSTGIIATNSNNGQLAKVESTIGTNKQSEQRFGYDSIGRLSESREQRGDNDNLNYKQKFDYDRFGNMYRKQANNQTSGQQTPVGFTPIEDSDISKQTNRFTTNTSYDDAGNVVQDTKFRNQNFWYDANGRIYKTQRINFPSQSNAVYDASGMRVANQVDGVWIFSVYNVNGNKVAEYGSLQSTDEGGVKYVLADHQGSNRAVINNAGFVSARMDFTAFGEEIGAGIGQRTAAQGFGSSNTPDQKYALTERDKATGLDHTWFRKHENQAGRWTSPDPYNGSMSIGNPQSFNRYSYVENQPTNFVDPSGLNAAHYTCYDLTTYYSREVNGELEIKTATTTICNFWGGGGSPTFDSGGGEGFLGGWHFTSQPRRCAIQWELTDTDGNLPTGIVRKANTNSNHQFGTYNTIKSIKELGEEWAQTSNVNIRAGDISLVNGKNTPDHTEHQKGNQFDIGLFRKDNKNLGGVTYKDEKIYDRETTQKLVDILEKDPNVLKIIFNDPKIKGNKIARDSTGVHDNHLHVEYNNCR